MPSEVFSSGPPPLSHADKVPVRPGAVCATERIESAEYRFISCTPFLSTAGGNYRNRRNHAKLSTIGFPMMSPISPQAAHVLKHPGAFSLQGIKAFRANQGLLLAGAVAYCPK